MSESKSDALPLGYTPRYLLRHDAYGGETGIRTLEGRTPLTVFKTAAFDRSAISPKIHRLAQNV